MPHTCCSHGHIHAANMLLKGSEPLRQPDLLWAGQRGSPFERITDHNLRGSVTFYSRRLLHVVWCHTDAHNCYQTENLPFLETVSTDHILRGSQSADGHVLLARIGHVLLAAVTSRRLVPHRRTQLQLLSNRKPACFGNCFNGSHFESKKFVLETTHSRSGARDESLMSGFCRAVHIWCRQPNRPPWCPNAPISQNKTD